MQDKKKSRAQHMADAYPKKLKELGVIKFDPHEKRLPLPRQSKDGSINWWTTILNTPKGGEDAD